MEAFGIIGFTFGMTASVFSLNALAEIRKLEARIKQLEGVED